MSDTMTPAKTEWLNRVLGIQVDGARAPMTAFDLSARQGELAALVPQFAAAAAGNPDLLARLRKAAVQVAATLKLGLTMNAEEAGRIVAGIDEIKALLAATPAAVKPDQRKLLELWRDAKETVDEGITRLQTSMRKHPLAALGRIADAGLNGITNKAGVGMMAALMEADKAGNPAAARKVIAEYRAFLSTDTAAAVDDNPFKIEIGLRKTLGAALRSIEQRLGA